MAGYSLNLTIMIFSPERGPFDSMYGASCFRCTYVALGDTLVADDNVSYPMR